MARIKFSIEELDMGFVVNVGCKRIATNKSFDEIISELKRYFSNPYDVEREYFPSEKSCEVDAPRPCDPEPYPPVYGSTPG